MKKITKFIALALTVAFVSVNAFAAEDTKIAVLDMQLVMNGTATAISKQADLKKRGENAQKRFLEMEESFQKQVEELERKKSILSEDKYIEEQSELRRIGRERQAEVQMVNEKLSREYKRVQKEISDEVEKVVEAIAKESNYDVVLAKGYLLYSSKSVDISAKVLKRVDAVLKKKNSSKGL